MIGRSGVHLVGSWVPWIFAGFAFAFLVKTPVWPLHTWMPLTYATRRDRWSPSVSAVQSKAGLYGLIAICMAFMPDYLRAYAAMLFVAWRDFAALWRVYALVQNDTKRVVAYSSLSHLGLIVIAIASFNPIALQGALIYMIATRAVLGCDVPRCSGYVESREETRSLARLGGLGRGESAARRCAVHRGARHAGSAWTRRLRRRDRDSHRRISKPAGRGR